tara:strand:+ start:7560 stop:11483 length:3924 start_codon:yes stop_codon:yes gene_type:complete
MTDTIYLPKDFEYLSSEYESYLEMMESETDRVYEIAKTARSKGLDFKTEVEIPRAKDLASRTVRLLDTYLRPDQDSSPIQIEDRLRDLLDTIDRESASITIARESAKMMHELTGDLQKSMDTGLRVGLAVLTEAVLVAPLEGIGEVRILSNHGDGSSFLSIDFCGPIRAAGGTAQAMGVLIGDIIRRELGIDRYRPSEGEVERVKEEFGLYRGGLQYKPPPEEVDMIVRACPVMVNGEGTERIEVAGYREVPNIQGSRIRQGVLLVIAEGLCLKAPKIKKHTDRLGVEGWDFIDKIASKGKENQKAESEFDYRQLKPDERYMDDIIAGRPVFGEPSKPGAFRLRYGRSRTTGLAAAGLNPITMHALGGFLSVGTQMKIERPGKACAVTPTSGIDGPMVLLEDKSFVKIQTQEQWSQLKDRIAVIWDAGEILIGYGEFLENNKSLVPSGYNKDWWASELASKIDMPSKLERFLSIIDQDSSDFPRGLPFNGAVMRGGEQKRDRERRKREWNRKLKQLDLSWEQVKSISRDFGTAIPPPWNLWWSDLPVALIPAFAETVKHSTVTNENLLIPISRETVKIQGLNSHQEILLEKYGLERFALMSLGVEHRIEGNDLVVETCWEPIAEIFSKGENQQNGVDIIQISMDRIQQLDSAKLLVEEEEKRVGELETLKTQKRIRAETEARQRNLGVEETEAIGNAAASEILDPGPPNQSELNQALITLDDDLVENSLWVVRKISSFRWEDSIPTRIGARMGRPEKAQRREMKQFTHALYPIGNNGGPQRLLDEIGKGALSVDVSIRRCTVCGRDTHEIQCRHDHGDGAGPCNGRTEVRRRRDTERRLGEKRNIQFTNLLESARKKLNLNSLPKPIKATRQLESRLQTPEPLEKGILRALHDVSVNKDGTSRFDMIDVPVTHFRPSEIGTPWQKLVQLGYKLDMDGNKLVSDEQILEIFPQDIILSSNAESHLSRTCRFVDDELTKIYGMDKFYNYQSKGDLVGHLGIGLAPHTSGGVLCRIIGWSDASAGYAHPLFHAAKRRNCDGDEDCVMLLLEGLLNFSKDILPSNRGGQMDAPLVLTTRLLPSQIDKEALNVDCSWVYPPEFYAATLTQPHPSEVKHMLDIVENRIGGTGDVRGYGWTHDSAGLSSGPSNSQYKLLPSMEKKMDAQLSLASKLRAVSVERVAKQVIESHFLRDIRGNLVAFTRQKIRCTKCNASYRRIPLGGSCIAKVAKNDLYQRLGSVTDSDNRLFCGGNLTLTVSPGAVTKYIGVTNRVMDKYGIDLYTRQRVEWMQDSVDSLLNNDKVTVMTLSDFI